MKFYSNVIDLNGKKKVLFTINHHENNEQKLQQSLGRFHHIHCIDRSGSMHGSIDELIEDLVNTLPIMGPDDIVTIVWFSSVNQQGIIVKGAKNTPELKDVIRKYASVVGATCFSKPLEMISSIIEELKDMSDNTVVNFFTDGMPVCPWSDEEEYKKSKDIVSSFSDKIMAFNSVGYGNYYSQQFLKDLSSMTQYGQFVHASDIREYQKIFDTNYKIVKENILEKLKVDCFQSDIFYLNRKITKHSKNIMKLSSLDNNKNQVFVLVDDDAYVTINDENIRTDSVTEEVGEQTLMNFYYAYAYNMYYNGYRDEALRCIVRNIGNGYLADRQLNAWTFSEAQDYEKAILARLFSPEERVNDAPCKSNYIPKDNAFCLMDLISMLSKGKATWLPFHKEADSYERIGKKTNYSEFAFISAGGEVEGKFDSIVFNKERCNIGIKVFTNGYVNLKPEDQTPSLRKIECSTVRTYNLVVDGYPNIKKIVVRSSTKLYNAIIKKKVGVEHISNGTNGDVTYSIYTTTIPVINKKLATGISGNDVLLTLKKSIAAEATSKVAGYLLEKAGHSKAKTFKTYSPEEQALLSKYGINGGGIYEGLGVSVSKNEDCDFYMSKNVQFVLKGLSKLPSVNEFLKKYEEAKKNNKDVPDSMIPVKEAYLELTKVTPTKEQLESILSDSKDIVSECSEFLASVKMGIILTGSWIPDFVKTDKNEFLFQSKAGNVLMSIEEKKQYF